MRNLTRMCLYATILWSLTTKCASFQNHHISNQVNAPRNLTFQPEFPAKTSDTQSTTEIIWMPNTMILKEFHAESHQPLQPRRCTKLCKDSNQRLQYNWVMLKAAPKLCGCQSPKVSVESYQGEIKVVSNTAINKRNG